MKYKSFQWPHNPAKLSVTNERNIKELRVPFSNGVLQDYGGKKRVVTGEGEFNGSDCFTVYQQLLSLFTAGGSGLLSLPGVEPFMAVPVTLEQIGRALPNSVAYRFVFWEDQSLQPEAAQKPHRCHVCTQGENLWQIAADEGTTVNVLVALNPQIQWPNMLREGEKVVLP